MTFSAIFPFLHFAFTNAMGRPRHSINKSFKKELSGGGDGKVVTICRGCEQQVSSICSRLRSHADRCDALHAKPFYRPPAVSVTLQQFMNGSDLNQLAARVVLSTNLPFRWVDHPTVRDLLKKLGSGVRLNRSNIVKKYLPQLHQDAVQRLRSRLSGRMCTMAVDGWSTPDNLPVIGFSIQGLLVDLVPCTERHTAEVLANVTEEQIVEAEEKYNVTISAVVSDAAANMVGMRKLLVERRPSIVTYNCQAHQLNLCLQDFMKDSNRSKVFLFF